MESLPYYFEFEKREPINLKSLLPDASLEAIDLLDSLLQLNPLKRLKISEALQHPFFKRKVEPANLQYTKRIEEYDAVSKLKSTQMSK